MPIEPRAIFPSGALAAAKRTIASVKRLSPGGPAGPGKSEAFLIFQQCAAGSTAPVDGLCSSRARLSRSTEELDDLPVARKAAVSRREANSHACRSGLSLLCGPGSGGPG